ncbi:MAG: hypothetical protein EHM32_11155 [Spirochaetales bacterium]|nr:MAG: hypothetical protein EHM32_11155 [Spirochaetales bacterium]
MIVRRAQFHADPRSLELKRGETAEQQIPFAALAVQRGGDVPVAARAAGEQKPECRQRRARTGEEIVPQRGTDLAQWGHLDTLIVRFRHQALGGFLNLRVYVKKYTVFIVFFNEKAQCIKRGAILQIVGEGRVLARSVARNGTAHPYRVEGLVVVEGRSFEDQREGGYRRVDGPRK